MIDIFTSEKIEWISYLDKEYNIKKRDSNNIRYIYYPEIKITTDSENVNLIFRKIDNIKTQFIFKDNYGRAIYFTDVDIIKIMVFSEIQVFKIFDKIFLETIRNFDKEKILLVEYEMNGIEFHYLDFFGYLLTEEEIELLLKNSFENVSDMKINYKDLLLLISLILNKEYLIDNERSLVRVHRQLKKFLILMNFYRFQKYKDLLVEKNYNVDVKIDEVYYNNNVAKQLDLIFDQITDFSWSLSNHLK